jgi:demethylmenaquinone methyltransferase/2-methoxy-6-polyprenyl-1,4-benzoquinol methylase
VFDEESATKTEQARRVREMFATIAARYDLLNHLLSVNIDKRWRRRVAKTLYASLRSARPSFPGKARILDVACGTGDLSFTLFETGEARIVGLDFCRPMLQLANSKASKLGFEVPLIEGDALSLPFGDSSFEAATIAFGLRNLTTVETGFTELLRILKPGGRLIVLEFSKPTTPVLRSIFRLYFTRVLPLLGGLISGSKNAYRYLPESVSSFPDQNELASIMRRAGFEEVTFQNLSGGIAALHLGMRPH